MWIRRPPAPACATRARLQRGASAALTAIPGVVFSGSADGALRAYSTTDGSVLWEFDTNRDFDDGQRREAARGASMLGPGPAIAGGMLFVNSGYGAFSAGPATCCWRLARLERSSRMPHTRRVSTGALIVATISAGFWLSINGTAQVPSVSRTATPTFSRDVAPILYAKCVSCHRPGEVAPMPLITFKDVRPWARAIQQKAIARVMPPWGADPHYGRSATIGA